MNNKTDKNRIILFVLYFFVFVFLNYALYLILFKAPWATPEIFRKFHIDLMFEFLLNGKVLIYYFFGRTPPSGMLLTLSIIGFLIFYSYPALLLSRYLSNKLYEFDVQSETTTKKKFRPKFIITITAIILTIAIVSFFTYGFFLWTIPVISLIFAEYLLLLLLSKALLGLTKNSKGIISVFSILIALLVIITVTIHANSPIRDCRTGEFRCIAVSAASNNDPKICEKVGTPFYPKDCYVFLAIANENSCYCDLAEEKRLCHLRYEDTGMSAMKQMKRLYSEELNRAKFKDDSALDGLNCGK